jgi:hypothetical protein
MGLILALRDFPHLEFENWIESMVGQILEGVRVNKSLFLMWEWHGKRYLGFVRGLAGILNSLLQCPEDIIKRVDPQLYKKIEETVNGVISQFTLTSVNIQTSTSDDSDRLVHFCHGATGWIPVFCKMSSIYEKRRDEFIARASALGEVVWRRGLLASKGPGLCHGISGSVCGLLDLFRLTGDRKWLIRAEWFAMEITRIWKASSIKASRPYSLFEGIVGAYYALNLVRTERCQRSPQSPFRSCFPIA